MRSEAESDSPHPWWRCRLGLPAFVEALLTIAAARFGITKLSDLAGHPTLRFEGVFELIVVGLRQRRGLT